MEDLDPPDDARTFRQWVSYQIGLLRGRVQQLEEEVGTRWVDMSDPRAVIGLIILFTVAVAGGLALGVDLSGVSWSDIIPLHIWPLQDMLVAAIPASPVRVGHWVQEQYRRYCHKDDS